MTSEISVDQPIGARKKYRETTCAQMDSIMKTMSTLANPWQALIIWSKTDLSFLDSSNLSHLSVTNCGKPGLTPGHRRIARWPGSISPHVCNMEKFTNPSRLPSACHGAFNIASSSARNCGLAFILSISDSHMASLARSRYHSASASENLMNSTPCLIASSLCQSCISA